jgi:signal-transduction protein with cAMP-binding, CBS, and nucleotidyltransferase domain
MKKNKSAISSDAAALAAEIIEEISEEMCIEHLGYTPCIWFTGGSSHNDDRLTATIQDGKIIVSDGNAVEPYTGALTGEAIREYVSGWLHTVWAEEIKNEKNL